ncbi:MAG TPA: endo-alpha-N-acetylgalactosaminidase family protein [Terracidiphilus sp.]|nr:endo-alpha-N-acetylgalactosaminidase family protein [Terracidiphilus sp.]
MQEESNQIRRRDFLRLGAAGAAAAGLQTLLPACTAAAQAEEPTGTRSASAHPLVLRSTELEVTLDADNGLPYEYLWRPTGARIRGEDFGRKITATVCQNNPSRFFQTQLTAEPGAKAVAGSSATFHFTAKDGATPCARFQLHYKLTGPTLFITMDNIAEERGYDLIDAAMPRLATVREEDPSAWFVYGDSGGAFALLADATAGTLPPNSFWGRIHCNLPLTMVGTDRLLAMQETTALMDTTEVTVTGSKPGRRASIGSGRVHRVNGGDCYNLNLGRGAPLNCGNSTTPNLLVEDTPSCRLDFMPVTGDPRNAWIAAGKTVRGRMPSIPKPYYHDKYIYGVFCDLPNRPAPPSTFAQCEQLIADVAALTDNAPQIVHLWGWQFRGKDTGYPAVNVVDERIGGYDGMMRLMQQGREHNATVTLSDNYDDAYKSSPAWDEAMIARRPDGELWKSRAWTGEASYIQGLAKYMELGRGVERVRYTCERYKLPYTTHIDVLSYYTIRNDWDRQHPASGIRNLRQGRYRILAEFARHGVDVTSEAMRYGMVGHISAYWYAQPSLTPHLGAKAIPLHQLVYSKSAIWGLGTGMRDNGFELRASNLFWNANLHAIMSYKTDRQEITDMYYLIMVPWLHLHQREVVSFVRDGDRTETGYEGDTRVEIDWSKKSYRVILEDNDVATEESVFCPLDADRVCFYSTTAQQLTAAWPKGWNKDSAAAAVLSTAKREQTAFTVERDKVSLNVPERQPVILYRDRKMAKL